MEGLGSVKQGLGPIQERLAQHNGTQCGFCSPGMVMAMSGLLQRDSNPTKEAVEKQLDGNICRCTGFRPILDAFKSFCQGDAGNDSCAGDIEDMHPRQCIEVCSKVSKSVPVVRTAKDQADWFYPRTVPEVFKVMQSLPATSKKSKRRCCSN